MYQRILSLAPSNTEILYSLEAEDKIAGATYLCDYPEQSKSIPKVSSWIYAHDLTLFEKLKPDLILTSMFVPKNVTEWADRKDIHLVNVYPQTLDGIYKSIKTIGSLIGREKKAREVINSIKSNLDEIKKNAKMLRKYRIYCEEWHKPPTVSANWVPELIEIAGGKTMAEKGILSYETKLETLKKFDPEIIVLHWCGFKDKSSKEEVLKRKGWETLDAVKNGRIFAVDDTFLNRPGPRIWKGAELLQHIITQIK